MVVLILEDDRSVSTLCKRWVQNILPEASIVTYERLSYTLALLNNTCTCGDPIVLFLTDHSVIGGNSLEAIELAKSKRIPVIAMSGDGENSEPMLEAGARRFIFKPCLRDLLPNCIREVMGLTQ